MGNRNTLSVVDIAVYALYLLDGWQRRIHTEDIALKCFELAPSRFCWVKYKQYPDLMTAWFALGDAKKERYGGLVIGGSERKRAKDTFTGWRLSEEGISWIKENRTRIENALANEMPPMSRLIEDRRMKYLLKSAAFKKYLSGGDGLNITRPEFAESIICTVNTGRDVLSEKIAQLYSAAEVLRLEKVRQYLDFCRERFLK